MSAPSLDGRLVARHSTFGTNIDHGGGRRIEVCRSRNRTVVLSWCGRRMRDLQLRAQGVGRSQDCVRRKPYIGIGLIYLGRRDVSHPGHGFRCAVVTLCDRWGCEAISGRRRATFLRAGIRRRVHGARYKWITQCFVLRLSCCRQTAGYQQCKSSGFEAFFRLSRCRIAFDVDCSHWSLNFTRFFVFSLRVRVSQGCDNSRRAGPGYSDFR